ncbi:hypothetical protein [Candidatus Pyrohabitans sp.]
MKIRYCAFCGARLTNANGICPSCGADMSPFFAIVGAGSFASELKKIMGEIIDANARALEEIAKQMEKGKGGVFFSVEMQGNRPPVIRTGRPEDLEKILGEMPIPEFVKQMFSTGDRYEAEFKEARVEKRSSGRREVILVEMPGIERLEDVEIAKKHSSLEVAGRAGRVVYFAQVPLEENTTVVDTSLENGVLRILVERCG